MWQQRQPGGRAGQLGQPQAAGQGVAGGWIEVGFGHPSVYNPAAPSLHHVLPASEARTALLSAGGGCCPLPLAVRS